MKNILLIMCFMFNAILYSKQGWGRGPRSNFSDTSFLIFVTIIGIPIILFVLYLNYSSNRTAENNRLLFQQNGLKIEDYITGCLIYQCPKGVKENIYLKCENYDGIIEMTIIELDVGQMKVFNKFKFRLKNFYENSTIAIKGEDELTDTYKYKKFLIRANNAIGHRFLFRVDRRNIDNTNSDDFAKYIRRQVSGIS